MTTPLIYELQNVQQKLSDSFSLSIDRWHSLRGEVQCVVGPNGAGKTTLLKLLTGLTKVNSGTLRFADREWKDGTGSLTEVRQVCLIPQRPLLLARSVRANLEYGLRLRSQNAKAPVDEILNRLGIEHLAARSALSLSAGQTQLVALGRALVLYPQVLLLDEPTANLDPSYVGLVEKVLRDWNTEYQTTLIWATHQMNQARRMADRVVLLLEGRVIEAASCVDFFHRPADARTEDFVQGRMIC